MLDMRFSGLPRFVTGFSPGPWAAGNDDLDPCGPEASVAAGAGGQGRGSLRYPRRVLAAMRQRLTRHLTVVK